MPVAKPTDLARGLPPEAVQPERAIDPSAPDHPSPADAEVDLSESHAPPGFLAWVGQLVHRHRAELVAFARRLGLDAQEALDAVQDGFISFLRLPQARAIADTPEDAIKLLTVLVRHNAQNQRRTSARRARLTQTLTPAANSIQEGSEALLSRAEDLARVSGCILHMAELQRRVIMLSLLDEQPRDQVASLLGLSAGHVRVLLHRAREHVRNCADEYKRDPQE